MKNIFLALTSVAILVSSCAEPANNQTTENNQPSPAPTPVEEIVKTVVENPEVITTESGLQYEILVESNGKSPNSQSFVTTHYHGTLLDGTVFDSSVERGEPIQFGVGQVIQGWQEALVMMKKGEKWRLTIPGHLAYGEFGAGELIGPNATLVFEIELIDFQ